MRWVQVLIMLAAVLPGRTAAQGLVGSQWAFNAAGSYPFVWLYFGTDTASWSAGSPFATWATVTYSGDTVELTTIDTLLFNCSLGSVGRYTYSIQNDTLRFDVVSDSCGFETVILNGGHGVPSSIGLPERHKGLLLALYPNPVQSHVRLTFRAAGPHVLWLCDTQGRTLRSFTFTGYQAELDLQDLPDGVYLLRDHTGAASSLVVRH